MPHWMYLVRASEWKQKERKKIIGLDESGNKAGRSLIPCSRLEKAFVSFANIEE